VGPADFSYGYDSGTNGIGHLTGLADKAGTGSYGYEVMGRLATETRTLIGANNATISKNISYVYNLDGSVNTLTYPSGKVITYTPWHNGALGVSAPQEAKDLGSGINYVTSATYGPDGSLAGFISGSGGAAAITNLFSYNNRLQPCRMTASTGALPVSCADADPTHRGNVYDITYDFHVGNGTSGTDNGNVWGITNNKDTTRNQTFTYDPLNRLISAQNAGTNCAATTVNGKTAYWGNSYGYDAWGNMLSKTVTKCGAENLSVTADAHNWIHSAAPDYQYDAAGNMTYDATAHLNYTFDQENRLTGAAGYTYTYDADGNRVRKSNGNLAANGTLYWYMTPGVVAESDLAGTLKSEYIFFDGERVARRDGATGGGGVFYYFSDHLQTASVITDSAGVIKAESDYYPWGGELKFVDNDSNDYKFTGKKRDIETGLDYFGARYYSNGLGRWISADWSATPVPVPYANFYDPQTLNLYQFVGGNPASKADPDGHACPPDCLAPAAPVNPSAEEVRKAVEAAQRDMEAGEAAEAAEGAAAGGLRWAGPVALALYEAAELIDPPSLDNSDKPVTEFVPPRVAPKPGQIPQAPTVQAARKNSKTTRREWEKAKGKKWPKDKDGNNYDADHKKALADGGSNNAVRNIQPRTRKDHIRRHKKNGDFRRWAKRRKKAD
jgi:RHS repeat-associated protein